MNSSRNIKDIRPRLAATNAIRDEAIAQAKAQPDYRAPNAGRAELESFLRVERTANDTGNLVADKWNTEADRDSLIPDDVQ